MTKEICNPEYLAKALLLKQEERERVLSRMGGKLPRRLAKDKLTVDEALAIQLEIEDEQLAEWREKMHAIKAKDAAKDQKKKKAEEKSIKADEKPVKVVQEKPAKSGKKAEKISAPVKAEEAPAAAPAETAKPAAKPKTPAKAAATKRAAKHAAS